MKEKSRQKLLILLIVITLTVTVTGIKFIGDKVAKYQSYSDLQKVLRLSHPIHASIDHLQKERAITSLYLSHPDELELKNVSDQFIVTDRQLNKFATQLKATQMLLLSMPESELAAYQNKLIEHRKRLVDIKLDYLLSAGFYESLISNFTDFMANMYKMVDQEEFGTFINTLMNSEHYKEAVSQEKTFVSFQISKKQIPPGEIPLIRQFLTQQELVKNNLFSTKEPQLKERLEEIVKSSEYLKLEKLRKGFDNNSQADLVGTKLRANEYLLAGMDYLSLVSRFNQDILFALDRMASEGKNNLKNEIIKIVSLVFFGVLFLIGIFFYIQKKPTT